MAKTTLCIEDEVLLTAEGEPHAQTLPIILSAMSEWKKVVVFTRRPGVAKRAIGAAESMARRSGVKTLGKGPIWRRLTYSMRRPEHSVLLATNCINWTGKIPAYIAVA